MNKGLALPFQKYAIVVDSRDDVAVAKTEITAATVFEMPSEEIIEISGTVAPGHRFAACEIAAGELVSQYGQPIGTSLGIAKGALVSADERPGLGSRVAFAPPADAVQEFKVTTSSFDSQKN